MQDLGPNSVFLLSAFMPSQEEVRAAQRPTPKTKASSPLRPAKLRKVSSLSDAPSPHQDSSLPNPPSLLRSSSKGQDDQWAAKESAKGEQATKGKKVSATKSARRAKAQDCDYGSDYDMSAILDYALDVDPKGCRRNAAAPGNGKGEGSQDEKDVSMSPEFDTWELNGNNVEPSAKMKQMVAYIKEWEAKGDKTIVFSQCGSTLGLVLRGDLFGC